MKRGLFALLSVVSVFFLMASFGCNLKITTVTWGPTKTQTQFCTPTISATITPFVSPTITPTSTTGTGVYVSQAVALEMGSITMLSVILQEGASSGPALTGATVTIGSYTLTEGSPGTYSYIDYSSLLFASGDALNLSINSSQGAASASIVMPKSVTITNPSTTGQSVSAGSNFTVQWTYPNGAPSGQIYLYVASTANTYVSENLAGSTVSRLITANTFTSGESVTIELQTTNTASITGAVPGSGNFMGIYQGVSSILTTP
jgi:hypothetical protein